MAVKNWVVLQDSKRHLGQILFPGKEHAFSYSLLCSGKCLSMGDWVQKGKEFQYIKMLKNVTISKWWSFIVMMKGFSKNGERLYDKMKEGMLNTENFVDP